MFGTYGNGEERYVLVAFHWQNLFCLLFARHLIVGLFVCLFVCFLHVVKHLPSEGGGPDNG